MNYQHLRGVRIIESSAFISAPLAGLTLAQFGADVIRIDMIGGGIDYARMPTAKSGRSLYWTGLNKDKRSIAIDIRRPEGRQLVQRLVCSPGDEGGVLLTNIATPWLAHKTLAALRRDVITCTIQGNADGSTAVDYTVNCSTGYPQASGSGGDPVNSTFPAWDACCAYQAAFALTAALRHRELSGEGAELQIALSDVAFSSLSHLGVMTEAELYGRDRPAIGNNIYGAFGRDFATADGRRVMVAGISAGQWRSLVAACNAETSVRSIERITGRDLSKEEDRHESREEIAAVLAPWFAARTFSEVGAALDAGKVCWGPYRTVTQLLEEDPRVGSNNPIYDRVVTQGVGEHWAAGTPVRQIGVPRTAVKPAGLLGQDTEEVLADVLRLSSAEIGTLHDRGIVASADRDPTLSPPA